MDYNNSGIAKKFTDGIILSFVILGLFMLLQLIFSIVIMLGVMSAFMADAGGIGGIAEAQRHATEVMAGEGMTVMLLVDTLVSTMFAAGFYWSVWGRRQTAQDRRHMRETVMNTKSVLMICIALLGLYYLALLVTEGITLISPETMESYNEMMETALGGSGFTVFLVAVLIAPINEECIMRGLVTKNLLRFFSEPAVIIMQAVMFGIFHANWVQGIYAVPVGAALGYVAVKSRSVIPCIFMHLFYNLLSFVVAFLPEFCQSGLFAVIVVVVCAALIFAVMRTVREKNIRR